MDRCSKWKRAGPAIANTDTDRRAANPFCSTIHTCPQTPSSTRGIEGKDRENEEEECPWEETTKELGTPPRLCRPTWNQYGSRHDRRANGQDHHRAWQMAGQQPMGVRGIRSHRPARLL